MRTARQRAIHRYVFEHGGWAPGVTSTSSFRAAVRDARKLTGRNVDTGALRKRLRNGKAVWPGILTYLALLDQIGKVITTKKRPEGREPFIDALEEFAPTLTERDREMLYALRCALAHEFALANPGGGRKAGLRRHLFELHEAGERELVIYPPRQWNGRYGRRANRKTGVTRVNLTELGNLMEKLVAGIEEQAEAGSLRLVEGLTPAMVISRWGFQTFEAPFGRAGT